MPGLGDIEFQLIDGRTPQAVVGNRARILIPFQRVLNDVAVIGVPDERLGEVGRAFVVTRPGARLDEQSVIAYTRQHLANFKAPRSVRFVDALPRNPGGKVVKPQLRELA